MGMPEMRDICEARRHRLTCAPLYEAFGGCLLVVLSACSKGPARERATQANVAPAAASNSSAMPAPAAAPSSSAMVDLSARDAAADPVAPRATEKDAGAVVHHDEIVLRDVSLTLQRGTTLDLRIPDNVAMNVAAEGMKRARFMTESPDGRLFITDLIDMSDNSRGIVYVLSDFDAKSHQFGKRTPYLTRQRNPNNVAFHTDAKGTWIYIALTDRLVRYRYVANADAPSGEPETLATFPDYGLNYKYGGWHLTRTVTFGPDGTLYVSAGSSCNACDEKEEVRATVQAMTADGKNARFYARGLRNSVGLKWVNGSLFATDMGADQYGNDVPDERFFALKNGADYGWPHCYQDHAKVKRDPVFGVADAGAICAHVPAPFARFPAHAAPLGFEYFDDKAAIAELKNSFVVALHGSTKKSIGHGYRVVRVHAGGAPPVDVITGFMRDNKVYGRAVDVLKWRDGMLVSDDFAGAIYFLGPRE
jgi:glucose/arabinose dehydrogenase